MRYRRDRYEMTEGETNLLEIDLAPTIGSTTLDAFDITASGLTFTTPDLDDRSVTTKVSGGTANTNYIATTTATLSDGQVKVGSVILEWKAPGYEYRTGLN